jgi:glutathione synthase/RimK-type ligase-like ATP-grasp enzyme
LKSLAILVSTGMLPLKREDALLAATMRSRGWSVAPIAWTSEEVRWEEFDCVLVRSTWDYHLRVDDFLRRLEEIAAAGPRLANSASLIGWNANKTYLKRLSDSGLPTVPTEVHRGLPNLAAAFERFGSDRLVAKPVVGASAYKTFLLKNGDGSDEASAALTDVDCILQPFVPTIATLGETSMVFLGGQFSHAVQKLPAAGDYRVQEELGGRSFQITASRELRDFADSVVTVLPEPPLYARIDVVRYKDQPVVMEVELIEPDLFVTLVQGAVERFADAVEDWSRG